jgi:anti-sigma B factor antagonist
MAGNSTVEYSGFGGDIPVIHVAGEADAAAAPALRAQFHELQEAEQPNVVVDLLGVTFVDSTILGILVAASRSCQSLGGELRLVINEGRIRRVFEITGLVPFFSIHPSLDAALHAE